MILLLPLRGLMGDAMATQMLAPAMLGQSAMADGSGAHHHVKEATAHSHAEGVKLAAASAVRDCLDHASVGQFSSLDGSDCKSCPACQACNIVAFFMPDTTASFVLPVPLEKQQSAMSRFTSADPALSVKPPIS